MPFDCGSYTIEAEDNLGGVGWSGNCKCWPCPTCGPQNERRLKRWIAAGRPDRFITLSCVEGYLGCPILARERMAEVWNLVVRRFRRLKPTNKCEYAVICEKHLNGWPHLHIAWKGPWIDQGWLSKQMDELLQSPVVWVQRVYSYRGTIHYLTKYMTSGLHQFGSKNRYWFSQGYPRRKKERQRLHRFAITKTNRRNRSFAEMLAEWERLGRNVQYLQGGGAAWGHWWATGPPPKPAERGYWHFRSGIPHLRTKRGWLMGGA